MNQTTPKFITDAEAETLILRYVEAGGTINEQEAQVLLSWANQIRAMNATLNCVLKGAIVAKIENGEVMWRVSQSQENQ